jgi:hypothetical protein
VDLGSFTGISGVLWIDGELHVTAGSSLFRIGPPLAPGKAASALPACP